MTSLPPAGIPPSSNQPYVIGAAILLLLGGGLVAYKVLGNKPADTKTTIAPVQTNLPAITRREDDTPPPPDPIPEAGPPVVTKPAGAGGGGGYTGCDKVCNGSAGNDLTSAVALRGRQARKCYENQLAQDPKLTVKMTLKVRVGPSGQSCGVTVASSDNPQVASCVANFFRSGFPAARGGCVEVTVPLNFVPGR